LLAALTEYAYHENGTSGTIEEERRMSTIARISHEAVTAALRAVSQIDLSPINEKLQYDNPVLWSDETIAQTEVDYRRFLALNLLYPSKTLVVNKNLDDYWHQHILDTHKYAADCDKLFGSFLHHYPYFGMKDDEDGERLLEAFAVTQQLWEEAFGVSLAGESKLTLDKVVGAYQPDGTAMTLHRVYAVPQSCKCCCRREGEI
jgi:hypothetical protein